MGREPLTGQDEPGFLGGLGRIAKFRPIWCSAFSLVGWPLAGFPFSVLVLTVVSAVAES